MSDDAGRLKGWEQLNGAERQAAQALGYDESGHAWDAGETPPPCLQRWAVLSKHATQLHAAQTLGYTEEIWDAELMGTAAVPMEGVVYDDDAPLDGDTTTLMPGGVATGPPPNEVYEEYNGVKLVLSEKSGTGYKGVCLRPGGRFTVTHAGRSHGAFATPHEAAVRYAELIGANKGPLIGRPPSNGGSSSKDTAIVPAAGKGLGNGKGAWGAALTAQTNEMKKDQHPYAQYFRANNGYGIPPGYSQKGNGKGGSSKGGGKKVKGGSSSLHPTVMHYVKGMGEVELLTEIDGILLHLSPSSHTGYKGVGKQNSGPGKQFQAHLGHGAGSSLGYFASAVEAAIAYSKRVQELRGKKEADAAAIASRPASLQAAAAKAQEAAWAEEEAAAALVAAGSSGGGSSHKKRKSHEGGGGSQMAFERATSASPAAPRSHKKKKPSIENGGHGGADGDLPMAEAEEGENGNHYEELKEDVACLKCNRTGDAGNMLLCDGDDCKNGCHTYCCDPPLACAPAGDWYCPSCKLKREQVADDLSHFENMSGRQQMRYLAELQEKKEKEEAMAYERALLPPPPPREVKVTLKTAAAAHAPPPKGKVAVANSSSIGLGKMGGALKPSGGTDKSKAGSYPGKTKMAMQHPGGFPPLVTEAHGVKLYLSDKSSTGYLKVSTDSSENTSHKGHPFRAFKIAHAGKQGSFIGRYATAIEAAVAVAKDVRDHGLQAIADGRARQGVEGLCVARCA